MKETEKLKLKKPDPEDFYNIQDFNDNMDALDADQARQDKAIQEHAGNATIHVTQAEKDGWNGKVPPTRKVNGKALSEDISLAAADVGALGSGSTAEAAKKLLTPRSIRTNLASSAAANFDGTANITPGVTGVLPVANGGTGSSVEKYLPLAGGTIAGNLTLKNSTAFGCKLNFGDGDYVHISEPTDDNMEIKAKNVTFSTTNPIHGVPTPSAGKSKNGGQRRCGKGIGRRFRKPGKTGTALPGCAKGEPKADQRARKGRHGGGNGSPEPAERDAAPGN